MAYDPATQGRVPAVDRLSYNPLHDYRTVNVDAWAKQWFAFLADLNIGSQEYQDIQRTLHEQMALHPDTRRSDVADAEFSIELLRLLHLQNPFDPNAKSAKARARHTQWKQDQRLARRVSRQIVRFTLEYAEQYAVLRMEQEAAGTDYLTGVLNRRGLARYLNEIYYISDEPVRLSPSGEHLPPARLTLLYCDINDFKWINDNLGHHVGDRAIVETTSRTRAYYRRSENVLIVREGGDEFTVVLSDLNADETEALVHRLIDAQVDRAMSGSYGRSMQLITERLRVLRASGKPVRAEARVGQLTQEDIDAGIQLKHILYINGEPICPLYNIVTVSVGAKYGLVNNLQEVEDLRRSAAEGMKGAKQVFRRVLLTSRTANGNNGVTRRT